MNVLKIVYSTLLPNVIKFGVHLAKLLQKWKGCIFMAHSVYPSVFVYYQLTCTTLSIESWAFILRHNACKTTKWLSKISNGSKLSALDMLYSAYHIRPTYSELRKCWDSRPWRSKVDISCTLSSITPVTVPESRSSTHLDFRAQVVEIFSFTSACSIGPPTYIKFQITH